MTFSKLCLKGRWIEFLATGCYSGKMPFAPGTFGTLAGLPLCYLLALLPVWASAAFIAAFILFSIWLADQAEAILGQKDPGCVVIDEIAGIAVTLWGLSFSWIHVLAGFVVFRVLDIAKPFPMRQLEQKMAGGFGIVLDDVAAGIIGNIILRCMAGFLLSKNVLF